MDFRDIGYFLTCFYAVFGISGSLIVGQEVGGGDDCAWSFVVGWLLFTIFVYYNLTINSQNL